VRAIKFLLDFREFLFQITDLIFLNFQRRFLLFDCRPEIADFRVQRFFYLDSLFVAFVQSINSHFLGFDLLFQAVNVFPPGNNFVLRPFERVDESDSALLIGL